ncbi:uncharacterized protein ACB058_015444 isoform 1-T1 [Synchiropus picturatus]
MATYKSLQVQVTTIMEALTRAAVAEICGLLDSSYAVLQLEVRRSRSENEELRRKLRLLEGSLDPPGSTSQQKEPERGAGPQTSAEWATAERLRGETPCSEGGVVFIKKEVMTEEDQDGLVSAGLEVRSIKDEGDDGHSMTMETPALSADQWETSADQVHSQRSRDITSPAGGAAQVSPKTEFENTSDSGGEGSSGAVREGFRSEQGPGDSMNSTIVYEDHVSPWTGTEQLRFLPASLCQNLKPDRYLSDRALGVGPSTLNVVDLGSYCQERRFGCRFCGKRFTSSRILETHVRVHTGERPYSCAQCGKRFTQSGHLKTHQSVHTGERPYACQHCGKRFAAKQNLRIHQQKHHPAQPAGI